MTRDAALAKALKRVADQTRLVDTLSKTLTYAVSADKAKTRSRATAVELALWRMRYDMALTELHQVCHKWLALTTKPKSRKSGKA